MPQLTDPERYALADQRLDSMLRDPHWGTWLWAMTPPRSTITVVLDSEPLVAAVTRAWRHAGNRLPAVWAVDVPRLSLPVLIELSALTDSPRPPVLARRWGDISGLTLNSGYPTVREVVEGLQYRNGW